MIILSKQNVAVPGVNNKFLMFQPQQLRSQVNSSTLGVEPDFGQNNSCDLPLISQHLPRMLLISLYFFTTVRPVLCGQTGLHCATMYNHYSPLD